jgi:hypothetical protein
VAAFATAEDLASFIQVPTVDRYTAEMLLDLASDTIRDEVGQDIDQATTTETYDGLPLGHPWAHAIFLRQVPVTAVSSVVSDGLTLSSADYEWTAKGVILMRFGALSTQAGGITVTYTHGHAPGSRALSTARAICLQVAARAYVNPGQVEQITVGGISRSFARSDPRSGRLELSEYEKRRLDPLRR